MEGVVSWGETRATILEDLHTYSESERRRHLLACFLLSPPFQLLMMQRMVRYCRGRAHLGLIGGILMYAQRRSFGCYIHPEARLGRRIKLPHPIGIVIGKGARIGDDVTIFQSVTLGSHGKPEEEGKDYPVVEDGATIFAHTVVIGGVRIGQEAIIGAGSVVLEDVPAGAVAAGSPARILREPKKPSESLS